MADLAGRVTTVLVKRPCPRRGLFSVRLWTVLSQGVAAHDAAVVLLSQDAVLAAAAAASPPRCMRNVIAHAVDAEMHTMRKCTECCSASECAAFQRQMACKEEGGRGGLFKS